MSETTDPRTFVEEFFGRHPRLRRYAPSRVVSKPGGSGAHGEARQHGQEVWLFPKFWALPQDVQDFVFAHELGHYVLSEYGLSKFTQEAEAVGVDPWENLPFGQGNMDEAFADSFATHFINPSELHSRYKDWEALVKTVVKSGSTSERVAMRFQDAVAKTAGVEIPAEWFENHKRKLATTLGTKVVGNDLHSLATRLEQFADYLGTIPAEMQEFSRQNPYFAQEIQDQWPDKLVERTKNAAKDYLRLESALKVTDAFEAFVRDVVLDHYKRVVKTIGAAFENVPVLDEHKLTDLKERLRAKAPSDVTLAWESPSLTPAVLAYFKAAKVRDKVLTNALHKGDFGILRLVDRFFEKIGASKYLDPQFFEDHGIAREVTMGKAKVVILDPSRDPDLDQDVIKSFRQAYALLRRRGLDNVWYGPLLYVSVAPGTFTKEEAAESRAAGYDVSSYAGQYNTATDEVWFYGKPKEVVHTIFHELGHRYWFRLLQPKQRAWFHDMVQTRTPEADTPEALQKIQEEVDYLPGPKDEEGYAKPVVPVSHYGGTNIYEAFAEVFADYVMGRKLNRDQLESFGQLVKVATMTAATKPPSKAQIDYAKHLLGQAGAEEPDWDKLDGIEVSKLIDDLKKKRGRPVWYGNGQFSHWEKAAADPSKPATSIKRVVGVYDGMTGAEVTDPLSHIIAEGEQGARDCSFSFDIAHKTDDMSLSFGKKPNAVYGAGIDCTLLGKIPTTDAWYYIVPRHGSNFVLTDTRYRDARSALILSLRANGGREAHICGLTRDSAEHPFSVVLRSTFDDPDYLQRGSVMAWWGKYLIKAKVTAPGPSHDADAPLFFRFASELAERVLASYKSKETTMTTKYNYNRTAGLTNIPLKPELVPELQRALKAAEADKAALEGILPALRQVMSVTQKAQANIYNASAELRKAYGMKGWHDIETEHFMENGAYLFESQREHLSIRDLGEFINLIEDTISSREGLIEAIQRQLP